MATWKNIQDLKVRVLVGKYLKDCEVLSVSTGVLNRVILKGSPSIVGLTSFLVIPPEEMREKPILADEVERLMEENEALQDKLDELQKKGMMPRETPKPRLKIKVPFDTALEITQKGIGEYGPNSKEVLPGVRVVAMYSSYANSGMTGGEEHHSISLVVQWGDKFYRNEEPYCQFATRWGEVGDPDTEIFPLGEKRKKVTVSFVEVFPETQTYIVYK